MIREPNADPAAKPEDLARAIAEQRDALRLFEGSALAGIAAALAGAAESLARTARDLREIAPSEWMTAEAAAYLKRTPKAFEKIMAAGEIPSTTSPSGGSSSTA